MGSKRGLQIRCSDCAMATERCLRCGQTLCTAHVPVEGRRCAQCERQYRRHRPLRMVGYLLALLGTSIVLVLFLGVLVVATSGAALGVAPIILFGSFPVIVGYLESRSRRRFLADRRAPSLPEARLIR